MQIWNKTGQILPEIRVAGAEETEIEICSDNPINACSPFYLIFIGVFLQIHLCSHQILSLQSNFW